MFYRSIFILLLISTVYTHKVWIWLQKENNRVLWNRYDIESVENTCYTFDRPVNTGAMCAKGTWGWKCLEMFENKDCTGKSYREHINYLGGSCFDDFGKNKDKFNIKYKTDFWAYSAKTYNC